MKAIDVAERDYRDAARKRDAIREDMLRSRVGAPHRKALISDYRAANAAVRTAWLRLVEVRETGGLTAPDPTDVEEREEL